MSNEFQSCTTSITEEPQITFDLGRSFDLPYKKPIKARPCITFKLQLKTPFDVYPHIQVSLLCPKLDGIHNIDHQYYATQTYGSNRQKYQNLIKHFITNCQSRIEDVKGIFYNFYMLFLVRLLSYSMYTLTRSSISFFFYFSLSTLHFYNQPDCMNIREHAYQILEQHQHLRYKTQPQSFNKST